MRLCNAKRFDFTATSPATSNSETMVLIMALMRAKM